MKQKKSKTIVFIGDSITDCGRGHVRLNDGPIEG